MTHDFDPLSNYCCRCHMPLRMLAEDNSLEECCPATTRIWVAREQSEIRERADLDRCLEASREIDAEPLPSRTTWGDIRRALGFVRWPV